MLEEVKTEWLKNHAQAAAALAGNHPAHAAAASRSLCSEKRPFGFWGVSFLRPEVQIDPLSGAALRSWLRQAETDDGGRPGLTTDERQRLKELERENRELRRANTILRQAWAYFAAAAA